MINPKLSTDAATPETASALRAALTYGGALPFLAGAVLPALGVERIGAFQISDVVAAYGLTIASFMAGTHWGQQAAGAASRSYLLYLTSISAALCAWAGYLALPERGFLLVLALVFAALLAIDGRLAAKGVISQVYWRLRVRVTAAVIASLLAAVLLR